MRIQQTAFALGRAVGKHPAASRLFCLFERALPLQRLGRSRRVVAFHHPRPSWQPHILIVPTTPFPTLATTKLTTEQKASLLWEMVQLAQSLLDHKDGSWQMVINGGERQDIGQVHGHLIYAFGEPCQPGWVLTHPGEHHDSWNGLFEHVQRASESAGYGYSVIIQFGSGGNVIATLSTSMGP